MENFELVMMVTPLMGHFTPTLETVKLMLERNNQLSVTCLVFEVPTDPEGTTKIQSLIAATEDEHLQFLHLPTPQDLSQFDTTRIGHFIYQLVDYHKTQVRDIASKIKCLSGFLIDLTNTAMIDVADELGVPTYLFFSSGVAFLGLVLHFQALEDEHNVETSELVKAETELVIPGFVKPVPVSVLPTVITIKAFWSTWFLKGTRDFRRAKCIMVNTFADLESYALQSFFSDSSYGKSGLPPICPVGPVINRSQIQIPGTKYHSEMMNWLDCQPQNSVVFICFGSLGSFGFDQVQEIAYGLERSGFRFIWVLRRRLDNNGGFVGEYDSRELVLPKGFLGRTSSIGKVVGWVPQLAVLSHSAVGGFVSHCGWNSILESIFCGVPIATWPLSVEQHLNAFQLIQELKMAVEISLDYSSHNENQAVVRAEQIEKAIRELMDSEHEVSKRVKEFSEKSRQSMKEGGSSYLALENIIQDICSKS